MQFRVILGLLPIVALGLLVAIRCGRSGLRDGVLQAYLIWGCMIFIFTEVLSLFGAVVFWAVLGTWAVAVMGLTYWLTRSGKVGYRQLLKHVSCLAREHKVTTGVVLLVCGTTLLIALVAPPNNWDSMTVYMTRVATWIQNRSISHYPAHHQQQAISPPLASYAILHLQILSGGDRFANLIQWLGMIGALFAVAAVTKELGGTDRTAAFAVLFAVTIPMAVLQATSTQTDYITSMWLGIFAYLLLKNLRQPTAGGYMAEGAALGLAALTKYTALMVALPFAIWQAFAAIWKQRLRAVPNGLIAAVLVVGINSPHITRNIRAFGHPFASEKSASRNKNERFGVDVTFSNLLRNISLHLGTVRKANKKVADAIRTVHGALGINVTDPATSLKRHFGVYPINTHEDMTGNLVHFLLILLSLPLLLIGRKAWGNLRSVAYVLSLLAGIIIFCSYLKWSPWKQRLHLPWFILFGPPVAIALRQMGRRWPYLALSMILSAGCVPWLFWNASRPLIDLPRVTRGTSIFKSTRTKLYFLNRPKLRRPYIAAVEAMKKAGCRKLALVRARNGWEYPLWVLARQQLGHFTIHKPHAPKAGNAVKKMKFDAWIYMGKTRRKLKVDTKRWQAIFNSNYLNVYVPRPRNRQDARTRPKSAKDTPASKTEPADGPRKLNSA